jgi:hypothetical protein
MCPPMSRAAIAVPVGLLGFLLYIGAAVALADRVLSLHWAAQALYFVLAGVAWAWPAQRLVYWVAAGRWEPTSARGT